MNHVESEIYRKSETNNSSMVQWSKQSGLTTQEGLVQWKSKSISAKIQADERPLGDAMEETAHGNVKPMSSSFSRYRQYQLLERRVCLIGNAILSEESTQDLERSRSPLEQLNVGLFRAQLLHRCSDRDISL